MAEVPYQPFSTVTPTSPGEDLRVQAQPEAFGVNIGRAIEQLGTTTEKVGGELFQRAYALQDLKNENDAREASTAFTQESAKLFAAYGTQEGKGLADGLDGFLQGLETTRQKWRNSLGNPMAQKYFDREAASLQNRFTVIGAERAATGMKAWNDGTVKAQWDLDKNYWVDPTNEKEFSDKLAKLDGTADNLAGMHNWSPEMTADFKAKEVSDLKFRQIQEVAKKDVHQAYRMYEQAQASKQLFQDQGDHALDFIHRQNEGAGAASLAKAEYTQDISWADYEAKVRAQAQDPKINLGDAQFENAAVKAAQAQYNHVRFADRLEKSDNQAVINQAILSDKYQNIQEMLTDASDPKLAAAIHAESAKDPKFMLSLGGNILHHQDTERNQRNDQNFQRLLGMSQNRVSEFLNQNLWAEPMARDQRAELFVKQRELAKNPSMDPRVGRALTWMKQSHGEELRALGILTAPSSSATDDQKQTYDRYTGAVQAAVQEYQEETGKPIDYKTLTEVVGPTLIRQHVVDQRTIAGYHYWFDKKATMFQQEIPKDVLETAKGAIKEDASNRYGTDFEPTDAEVYRKVYQDQFRKFFQQMKEGTSAGGPSVPISR